MLFYVLGEMMSLLIGKLIPGSVCGMILLFIALTLKWIRPHDVDKAASALTRNMALFFVPASIGLMHEYKIQIAKEIQRLLGNGAISRNEIVECLPYPENEVIESLRFLQDEGFITACEDGIHYKNNK